MDDPKSVTQVWGSKFNPETQSHDPVNRLAELYGEGTRIQSITLTITDEPVSWGMVDRYLTEDFWKRYRSWRKSLNIIEQSKVIPISLLNFKGENKE